MDKIGQLKEKVNQNLSDYHEYIKGFGKQEIIDMAGKINAMSDAHMYLTGQHEYEEGQAEYLLGFKNPLELVADRISDLSDMAFDVNRIFYDRDMGDDGYEIPENDYAEFNKMTRHGEKATQLMARFDQNLSDIRTQMTILDRQGKSDMVSHCFAMFTAYHYISDRYFFSEREADYLLQFKNPLKIIADAWEKHGDIAADVGIEIDGICHTQKSERDGYELMEAGDTPGAARPVMPSISDRLLTDDVFSEKMQQLFPDGSPAALTKIMSYADYIDDSEYTKTQFYLETAAEFTLVKRLYGEALGTELFNLAVENCLKPHEIRVAANLLNAAVDSDEIFEEILAGTFTRTPAEAQESIQAVKDFIETVSQERVGTAEKHISLLDRRLAEHRFTSSVNKLLPDLSPNAIASWISYANQMEREGERPAAQTLSALATELSKAKDLYGAEIAANVFHVAFEMPIPTEHIVNAAAYLHNGGDINDVIDLSLADKLKTTPEAQQPAQIVPAEQQPMDVKAEADRIIAAVQALAEPNSPQKTHYAVPLSPDFLLHASTQDHDSLLKALPFKHPALTGLDGQKGIFVTVPKNERQKTSLLGKLATATKQAAAQARQPGKENAKKMDRSDR